MAVVDVEPGDNGHGDPNPRCTWHERRLDAIERYSHETRGALSAVSDGLSDLKAWGEQLETRWLQEFGRIASATESNQKTLKTLVGNLEVGTLRPVDAEPDTRLVLPSLGDYNEGIDTEVQDRPELVVRAKVAEKRNVSLEEEVASLRATLEERNRQSERARTDAANAATRAAVLAKAADESALKNNELAVSKWKITAGLIVGALMAAAAIGQAIASAFGH